MTATDDKARRAKMSAAERQTAEPPSLYQPTYMRAWREKCDLRTDEAAAIIGRHRSTLERIEQGKFKTGYNQFVVEMLAKAFQITPVELLFRDPHDVTDPIAIAILARALSPHGRRLLARLIETLREEEARIKGGGAAS